MRRSSIIIAIAIAVLMLIESRISVWAMGEVHPETYHR